MFNAEVCHEPAPFLRPARLGFGYEMASPPSHAQAVDPCTVMMCMGGISGSGLSSGVDNVSGRKYADVPTLPSLNTPLRKSRAEAQQINQTSAQQQRNLPQAPTQATPASTLSL